MHIAAVRADDTILVFAHYFLVAHPQILAARKGRVGRAARSPRPKLSPLWYAQAGIYDGVSHSCSAFSFPWLLCLFSSNFHLLAAEDYPKLLAGFEVRKNTAAASKAQSAAGSAAGTEAAVGKKPPAAASGAAAAAAGSATAAAASKSTPKLARRALDEDASFESDNFSLDGSAASGHKSSKADSKSMASVAAADDAAAAAPPEEEQAPLPPPAFFADHGNKVLFLRLAEWIICYQDTFLIGQSESLNTERKNVAFHC